MDLQFEKKDNALILVSEPLQWFIEDENQLKKIPMAELYENYEFKVNLTMNNIDWIFAGSLRYCGSRLNRPES